MTSKDTHKMIMTTFTTHKVHCVPIDWVLSDICFRNGYIYNKDNEYEDTLVFDSTGTDPEEIVETDEFDDYFDCESHQCENCGDMSEADLQSKEYNIWNDAPGNTMRVCEPCFAKTELVNPHRCSNYPCVAPQTCIWKMVRYCEDCKQLMIEAVEI